MDKITNHLFGMTAIFMLCIMITPAYADSNMICKESHVLVERTNGKMACLTEKTAERTVERFGWIIVSEITPYESADNSKDSNLGDSIPIRDDIQINPTSQTLKDDATTHILVTDDKDPVKLSDKKITMTNPIRDRVILSELGHVSYWPKYNMTFPEQVRIGEPFDVVFDYTYVVPDEDTQRYTHPEEQCSAENCEQHSFQITIPTYVDFEHKSIDISALVETDEKHVICYLDCPYEPIRVWSLNGTDTEYTPFRSYDAYTYDPLFDNTAELQEVFTFTINEPDIDYRYGKIHVTIHGDRDTKFYFYAAPNGIVYLDDDLIQSVGEGQGQLRKTPTGGNPVTAEERAQRPPTDGLPRMFWEEVAEHLRTEGAKQYMIDEYAVNGVVDYEQVLLDSRITQSWINEFFAAYPEFASQFVLPTLHWILPQAFAAEESTTIVFGRLVNTIPDGDNDNISRATVCAYDDDDEYTVLTVAGVDACAVTSYGGIFRLTVPRNDPNGPGNTDLVLKAFAKNNDFVVYKDYNQNIHTVKHGDTQYNISGAMINVGIFDISAPDNGKIPIEHRGFWPLIELNKIDKWTDIQNLPANRLSILFDPNSCNEVNFEPISKTMVLSHDVYGQNNLSCAMHINSPITNPDTLAHEYAHHIFYQIYDLANSNYPPSVLLEANGSFHSPVHGGHDGTAWIEGWAFFMATAYSGTPVYQPSYMRGQWNFEIRAHNEVDNPRFAGKDFHPGATGEGNVAAVLWDAFDTVNEGGDDQGDLLEEIIETLRDGLERDEGIVASNILEYKDDWDDDGHPSLDSIFRHNTIELPVDPSGDNVIFEDDFEEVLTDNWTLTSDNNRDWRMDDPIKELLGFGADNQVAYANGCNSICTMTIKNSIDLSNYSNAALTFWWYVDKANDGDEGLKVEVSGDGVNWTRIFDFTENTGDDDREWHKTSYHLGEYLTENFKVRIIAKNSHANEEAHVDNFKLTTTDTVIPIVPIVPEVNVPGAIDDLSFSYNTDYNRVILSWSLPDDNGSPLTAWQVDSLRPGSTSWGLAAVLHDETVTTWTGNVAQGYTYQYRVSAYNEDGLGPASNIVTAAVPDVTAPNISIRGNNHIEISLGMPYVERGAVAFDNHDGTITDRIVTTGSVDTGMAGTYQITYSVSDDAGNAAQTVRTVIVTAPDDTPPIITAPDDITAEVTCPGTSVNLGQATATDNTDTNPAITSNSTTQFPPGTTIILWTATDASGNTANATQTVIIRDTINPVLVPIDDLVSESITVNDYANLAPSVTDNSCDIITPTHDAPESFPVGTTTVTWTATDSAGNSASTTHTVTIQDVADPIIMAPLDVIVEVTCPGTTVSLGTAVTSDNYDPNPEITHDAPESFPLGTTTVTWTATDNSGNMATDRQMVTVRDITPPVISPIDNLVSEAITVEDYANLAPSVTDNSCDIITPTHDAPESFPLGDTPVTWTATDTAGNSASTIHIVTIQDRAPPIITAPLDVTAEVTCHGTTISLGTAMTSDNHDENPEITHDALESFPLGTTTVTWTATDSAGNAATDTQTVTIQDTTPPVIDVLTNPVWVNSKANFERVTLVPVNVSDNSCDPASLTHDAPELFPRGFTKVTWTAIDSSGNESIATQLIGVAEHRIPDMSPIISVPSDIIVYATDSAGTIVHYDAPTATDRGGNTLDVTCTPDSGIVFPIGHTKIMCSTIDSEGYAAMEPIYITVAEYNASLITESRPGYLTYSGYGTFDGQPTLNEEFSYTINIVNHSSENPNMGRIGDLANLIFYHPASYELISVDDVRLDAQGDVRISGQTHRHYILESNKPLPGQTVSIEFIFVPRTTDDITMRTHMHSITDNGHTTAHTLRDSFSAVP